MGSVLFAQNKPEEAFAAFNHAVELDPKRIESYMSLARFYIVTKDQPTRKRPLNGQFPINNNSAMTHTEYGKFLVQLIACRG